MLSPSIRPKIACAAFGRAKTALVSLSPSLSTRSAQISPPSSIWLTYNLPPLHLVDYDRFVKAWKKDGTQRMGIFKGAEAAGPDDPNSASQVVRRHLSATSPSPLYQ